LSDNLKFWPIPTACKLLSSLFNIAFSCLDRQSLGGVLLIFFAP
jgi:hypothetical protein